MTPRTLGQAAAVLAVAAALVGDPTSPGSGADAARMLEGDGGAVSAVQLARWIRDGAEGLRVIDLRDVVSFDAYHIPTAERMEPATLLAEGVSPGDFVVLYADGATAAQAWTLLARRDASRVRWLDGGVSAWVASIENPVIPADATPEELMTWPDVRALSLFFGGTPHRAERVVLAPAPAWMTPPGADADELAHAIDAARRRGCGFR